MFSFNKKTFTQGIILLISVLSISCSKDDCDCPTQYVPMNNPSEDEYYVRYAVSGSTIYIGSKMEARIRIEDSSFTTFSIDQTGDWENTIGPVKKDFNTSIEVDAIDNTHNKLKIQSYIYVSKNGSAFALKKKDESDEPRDKLAIDYTIDY